MPKVTAKVDSIGNVTFIADGFTGSACAEATGALEKVLAGTIADREIKPEYYEEAAQGQQQADRL